MGKKFNVNNSRDLQVCRKDHVSNNCIKIISSKARKHPTLVVPNIAHYVWFGNQSFRFDHLISMLSAYRIMQADKIIFHTDIEPSGQYWEETKRLVKNLIIRQIEQPYSVYDIKLRRANLQHKADIARLQILQQYGGVYMDNDVIVVKSLEPLRHYDFVMGRESEVSLNNGIILARNDSAFLRWYYKGYKFYNRTCWTCDSILYPNALAIQYPRLIHIEETSLVKPVWNNSWQIFKGHYEWWQDHYTIHTFIRNFYKFPENIGKEINYTPENIKSLNTAFGEICRFVYYGNKSLEFA
ncbi:uncharacterized protein LOC144452471 [Glandiceps talaboti]